MTDLAIFLAVIAILAFVCTYGVGYSFDAFFGAESDFAIDITDSNLLRGLAIIVFAIVVFPVLSSSLKDMMASKRSKKRDRNDDEE